MRIGLKTRPAALFGAIFFATLVALFPMRLALGWFGLGSAGLSARQASGSIWSGSLRDAALGDLALGDLDAHLSPLDLLVGRAKIFAVTPDQASHAAFIVSRHSVGLEDVSAALQTGRVFAPLPVQSLAFDDASVRYEDGQCVAASGQVRVFFSGGVAGAELPGDMTGTAKCDAGALLLPLAGASGSDSARIRIEGDGRYRADLTLQPLDNAASQKLVAAGFQPGAGGYTLAIEGRL